MDIDGRDIVGKFANLGDDMSLRYQIIAGIGTCDFFVGAGRFSDWESIFVILQRNSSDAGTILDGE